MSVILYDDGMVSLPRRHGKGDLDIVWASEGKCNRGIRCYGRHREKT